MGEVGWPIKPWHENVSSPTQLTRMSFSPKPLVRNKKHETYRPTPFTRQIHYKKSNDSSPKKTTYPLRARMEGSTIMGTPAVTVVAALIEAVYWTSFLSVGMHLIYSRTGTRTVFAIQRE
uniref:Uncharacterized protein n=1 Tax=Picea glauca TaxID=3330 RepID=A0A117NHI9_PICGL|nr:hypothetical protein ABT39_MTgene4473 [Picea glauca]QHR91317.1 hypothetical protein Q903MT_gene5349 [Picea sitchensis]